MMKNFKSEIIIILTAIFGIFLRILFYSYDRPFWNDECALALNLSNLKNYFLPLLYGQAAPPFFLIVSKLFYKIFKDTELTLRFFPLISSIFSIGIFYILSKKILNKKSSVLFALILLCFNYQLIYYGQEFKQYSSDVLFFTGILTSYFYLNLKNDSFKKLILTGIIYSLCIWFSFPSLFALFTVFLLLIIKNKEHYKKIFVLIAPALISFIVFYLSQKHLDSSNFLHNYWKEGFINQNFNNFTQIFINYFTFAFNNILLFFLFIIGFVASLSQVKKEKKLILIIPLILAIILSYFTIYPFSSRVTLYLIPVFILVIAQTLDYINFKNKKINYILCFIIIFLSSFTSIITSIDKICLRNFEYEDITYSLKLAQKSITNQDVLYIPDGSEISYIFYRNKFHFKNAITEHQRIKNINEYSKELEKLPKNKTYYYIYCHFPNKKQRLQDIYLWAKEKKDFKIYTDKSLNALIIFKL